MSKAVYMVADIHLGAPNPTKSLVREKHLVKWLDHISKDAAAIYLLGDVFDFWFEYKWVVPRGYVRLLGKLAELSDKGIPIHVFTGNHDLWHQDYFEKEIGASVYHGPVIHTLFEQKYYLAHGDGLGPGDIGYKAMKWVFTNPLCKWFFARLHPNFAFGLALGFSRHGGDHDYRPDIEVDNTLNTQSMHIHSQEIARAQPDIQYFVYGHRHKLIREPIAPEADAEILVLGDWIHYYSYLRITETGPSLLSYPINALQDANH